MKKVWRSLEVESQPVEIITAVGCVAMSATSVMAGSEWLPWPLLCWAWLIFATAHLAVTLSSKRTGRQIFAAMSVLIFGSFGAFVAARYGWKGPAAPALMVATLGQVWAFLAIESDRVDAVRRKGSKR